MISWSTIVTDDGRTLKARVVSNRSSSEADEGYSSDDGDSLPSIPSVGEVGEAEEEEGMDGQNTDGKMVVDGVVVPEDVYVPAFADDVAAVACGRNLEDLRESVQ